MGDAIRYGLSSRAWQEITLVQLQAQCDAAARLPHVRVYSTERELRATCAAPRCTMHAGHRGACWDGVQAVELPAAAAAEVAS